MNNTETKKKEFKAINPMLFLVVIILIVAVASYIIPAGSYDRVYDAATEREIVDPGSYHSVDRNPVTIFKLLMSVTLGMQNAAYIIFFLLIIGGMFAILNGTGAINMGMSNVVRAMKGRELLMIPVCMIVFGCGSAFCANFEEFLAFVPLVLAVCLSMGFDSLTAIGIIFCAAAAGYGGAIT
ncbi:MAG: C4-dicarboxylate ABC transporter permease, partial [Dorea sp.]